MEPWRMWRPIVADSHPFVEEQDQDQNPHQSEHSDPDLDPPRSIKKDPDPPKSHGHLQLCFSLYQYPIELNSILIENLSRRPTKEVDF